MTAGAVPVGPTPVVARWTERADGDMRPAVPGAAARHRRVVDRRWNWARQVHGRSVIVVSGPGPVSGEVGDALASRAPDVALAVFTADCAPVALASPEGVMAAVHVGWRGLLAGVVPAAVDEMAELGASAIFARVGPCIGPECYEFSPEDLTRVAAVVGTDACAESAAGRPALDMRAAVGTALTAAGVTATAVDHRCTACSSGFFSYRGSGDEQRQAMVVWQP